MLLQQGSIACFASISKEEFAKCSSWIPDFNTILDSNQDIKCTLLTVRPRQKSKNMMSDKQNDNALSIPSSEM